MPIESVEVFYVKATPSFRLSRSLPNLSALKFLGPENPHSAGLLRQEAEELAKLSAALPSQMDQVSQGKIPKELGDELKRIEKLAKHLRAEISR